MKWAKTARFQGFFRNCDVLRRSDACTDDLRARHSRRATTERVDFLRKLRLMAEGAGVDVRVHARSSRFQSRRSPDGRSKNFWKEAA